MLFTMKSNKMLMIWSRYIVVEESVKEVGDAVDVEENQHKWEHWPSPASSQEMGLQCTKKDWSFCCSLNIARIANAVQVTICLLVYTSVY